MRFVSNQPIVLGLAVLAIIALVTAVVHAAGVQRPASPAVAGAAQRGAAPATAPAGSCVQCHAAVTKHPVLHPKSDDCASCHVPTARDAHQFKDKSCTACHQMMKPNDKFVHGPVAAGECLTCHDPHGTDEPQLVRAVGACHNPHASPLKYQIRNDSAEQCLACHKTLRKELVTARVQHEAMTADRECLNCHDPHASDLGKQLKASSMDLCLSCHDRELDTPGGNVQNIKGWLQTHTDLHGPIRQQDCVGCHLPHNSEHYRLLRKDYPEKFYSPYDPKNYELCFMCHEPDMAKVERSATVTAFRDGDRNLHFVHVNRVEKGRTCRACHEAHSSSMPKHLRDTVPFGEWQLPVGYQQTADGGGCTPGCHLPMNYSRAKPGAAPPAPLKK